MANEKTYSAKEAAMKVLAKAKELLAKSSVTKQPETLRKSAEFTSGLHTIEYYEPLAKAASMKKDGSIQAGIAAAGGGGNTPVNSGVASSLGGAFGKKEDLELCEIHKAEGCKIVKSELCKSCKMKKDENIPHPSPEKGEGTTLPRSKKQEDWMEKGEVTELFQDLAKMEVLAKGVAQPSASLSMKEKDPASPEAQGAGNKEQPSSPPADPSKPTERDHSDFETKPGQSAAPDHREAPQTPPQANPKENAEGNNPAAGAIPGRGLHKLMYFKGHTDSKKKLKKGIALG